MARIKFYQGTREIPTEGKKTRKREYFSFRGSKFGEVTEHEKGQYAPEYGEFEAAVEAGNAGLVDDTTDELKIVSELVAEKKEVKKKEVKEKPESSKEKKK